MNTNITITFEEMVARLTKSGEELLAVLTPGDMELIHAVLGIAGEAGELLDAVKKHVVYRRTLDTTNVIEELGDLEFYMEGIRQTLGITRQTTLRANMEKLHLRYPGFDYTDAHANARADKA